MAAGVSIVGGYMPSDGPETREWVNALAYRGSRKLLEFVVGVNLRGDLDR